MSELINYNPDLIQRKIGVLIILTLMVRSALARTVDGQIKLGHLKFNLCKSDY
jgi:hypothetical protein